MCGVCVSLQLYSYYNYWYNLINLCFLSLFFLKKFRSSSGSTNDGATSPEKKLKIAPCPHHTSVVSREGGGDGGLGKVVQDGGQQGDTLKHGGTQPVQSHQMGALSGLAAYSSSDSSDAES